MGVQGFELGAHQLNLAFELPPAPVLGVVEVEEFVDIDDAQAGPASFYDEAQPLIVGRGEHPVGPATRGAHETALLIVADGARRDAERANDLADPVAIGGCHGHGAISQQWRRTAPPEWIVKLETSPARNMARPKARGIRRLLQKFVTLKLVFL